MFLELSVYAQRAAVDIMNIAIAIGQPLLKPLPQMKGTVVL